MFEEMKSIAILSLLVIVLTPGSYAQDSVTGKPAKVWSLKECVDYALENNLQIARSENNVRNAEIDRHQARMSTLPNLNATVSYGYNWGRSVNPVTYEYTTQQLNSINPGLSTSVTLFNGLRIQNTIKQTIRAEHASEQDLQKTKNDVMLNIASLYITVIFNK